MGGGMLKGGIPPRFRFTSVFLPPQWSNGLNQRWSNGPEISVVKQWSNGQTGFLPRRAPPAGHQPPAHGRMERGSDRPEFAVVKWPESAVVKRPDISRRHTARRSGGQTARIIGGQTGRN